MTDVQPAVNICACKVYTITDLLTVANENVRSGCLCVWDMDKTVVLCVDDTAQITRVDSSRFPKIKQSNTDEYPSDFNHETCSSFLLLLNLLVLSYIFSVTFFGISCLLYKGLMAHYHITYRRSYIKIIERMFVKFVLKVENSCLTKELRNSLSDSCNILLSRCC